MQKGCDLLVVAAFHPELAELLSLLERRASAGSGSVSVIALPVGIGLPSAAVGSATRVAELTPRGVVLVGTCGAYRLDVPGGLAIGEVAVARSVRLVEPAAIEGRAAIPEPMSLKTDAYAGISTALAALAGRQADIATTLGVTTDDALAARIAAATRCHVEHLEAFAVATACAAFGVPFASALGVANMVGSTARSEWRANHRAAAARAATLVMAWIDAGAPGLPPRA